MVGRAGVEPAARCLRVDAQLLTIR